MVVRELVEFLLKQNQAATVLYDFSSDFDELELEHLKVVKAEETAATLKELTPAKMTANQKHQEFVVKRKGQFMEISFRWIKNQAEIDSCEPVDAIVIGG